MASSKERKRQTKTGVWIRKHATSILMGLAVVTLLVSSNAKTWFLRQLAVTGIFNARIENAGPDRPEDTLSDFDFKDEKGVIQNTRSLRGKVVFINFWASWCPPCRAEFPSIEALYRRFKDNSDIVFMLLNEDDQLEAAQDFMQKEKYSLPLYTTVGEMPKNVYSGRLPTTLVIDKKGRVRFHHNGFSNYDTRQFLQQLDQLLQ